MKTLNSKIQLKDISTLVVDGREFQVAWQGWVEDSEAFCFSLPAYKDSEEGKDSARELSAALTQAGVEDSAIEWELIGGEFGTQFYVKSW